MRIHLKDSFYPDFLRFQKKILGHLASEIFEMAASIFCPGLV